MDSWVVEHWISKTRITKLNLFAAEEIWNEKNYFNDKNFALNLDLN